MPAPEWVVEQWPGSATVIAVRSHGTRDGRPTDETRYYVSSLRTGAKALLRAIRQRWSIENSWHWVRDVPLREDACQATLKTEPLPTSKTEPPLRSAGRLFSESFRLGLIGGWFGACSSFS